MSIVKFMIEHCKSERAYTSAGRIYANMLVTLTNVWAREHHSVNKDEWESERAFSPPLNPLPTDLFVPQTSKSITTRLGVDCTKSRMSSSIGTFRARRRSILPSSCFERSPFPPSTRSTVFSPRRTVPLRTSRRPGRTISAEISISSDVRSLESPRSSGFLRRPSLAKLRAMQGSFSPSFPTLPR